MIVGGAAKCCCCFTVLQLFPLYSLLENWTSLGVIWTWMVSQYHFQRMVENKFSTKLYYHWSIPIGESLGKAFDIGKRLQGSTFYAAVTLKVSIGIIHCPISFLLLNVER